MDDAQQDEPCGTCRCCGAVRYPEDDDFLCERCSWQMIQDDLEYKELGCGD